MARRPKWPHVEHSTRWCERGQHWACSGVRTRARDHEDKPRCECPCHWADKKAPTAV